VPIAEKKRLGAGERAASWAGHCELSVETRACSFGELLLLLGLRRDSAWTLEMEGRARSVSRM
jgi:hypothetical protein